MFAWHGSPLQNWHSIIRHGLDFKETLHGRAYGHGVYHAIDQNTSVGYAMAGAVSLSLILYFQPFNLLVRLILIRVHSQNNWPGSSLAISSAMSLNEIVNCPTQFVSSNPYVVVQHIDWIQCRYLFVQTSTPSDSLGTSQKKYVTPFWIFSSCVSD
jgi:ubiquitin-conjugating enzyme E2 Q